MKHFLLLAFVAVSLFACKEKAVEAVNDTALYDEVMAIHDKVMPEMANLEALKSQLLQIDSTGANEFVSMKVKGLDAAAESMNAWMAEFKVPEMAEEKASYLEAEKSKIQAVSESMMKALEEAKMAVDSLTATPAAQ